MATLNQIATALRRADAAGDVEAATRLAAAYRKLEDDLKSRFEPPKEQAGFTGAFKDAITTLGLTDEAAAFSVNPTEENRKAFLKAAESKYKSVGGFGKGENWEAFKELLGGSLGALVAPLGAGVVGGIPGFAATSGAQYGIQNLRRQAEEQQAAAEAGEAVPELSLSRAATAAAGQAALDVVPGALILRGLSKFPLAQGLMAEGTASRRAADVLADAFANEKLSLKGNVVKGVGLGVAFEVPQEIAQQALERWQAGLSLSDEEAKEEFKQAAIGAAVLGGGFGAIGGYGAYRGEQARQAKEVEDARLKAEAEALAAERERAEIEESLLAPSDIGTGGIPGELLEQAQRRESDDIARSLLTRPTESGIPYELLEEPEEREARLENEAIQAERRQYSAQTLREAAEAEALAPREEEEGAPYFPPEERVEEDLIPPSEEARAGLEFQQSERLMGDEDILGGLGAPTESGIPGEMFEPQVPSTEGVLEGLGAPTEGGVPAEMFEPTPRELALEVIKISPTIKAVAQATGLNQPKAAALMRQFVDEGIVEQKGNKFRVVTTEAAAEPETTDVSGPTVTTTETDSGAGGRSTDLFTLGPPAGELGTPPVRGAGLDTTGDVTERVDDREGNVPAALETEGVLEGLGAPTEGGLPPDMIERYTAQRARVSDLRTRALDFIRETGKGSAPDLQKALDIPLSEAKTLRSALLGTGAVVQKTNVKAAKTAGRSYFVAEGTYTPDITERAAGVERTTEKVDKLSKRQIREQRTKQAISRMGMAPYVEEETVPEAESRRREMDAAAELEAKTERKLPPTLSPDIGKGEYGLRYTDPEGATVYRAYPSVGERNEARAQIANAGGKDIATFSRMAEAAKFELDYARRVATPAMNKAQVQRAVQGIRAGMSKLKTQLGLFTEEEAPTPQKPTPKKVTQKELVDYAKQVIVQVRDAGKLKKYSRPIREVLDAVERGDTDLRAEYKRLQRIETRLETEAYEIGEAKQARLEPSEIEGAEEAGIESADEAIKDRDESYAPLDFRKLRFQKTRSETVGMRADNVRTLVSNIISGWRNPPNFVVVQSYLDLPSIEGTDPEAYADSIGISIGNDVYIIADNVRSPRDLKATVFHESLGHYGLARLFGEQLFKVMLDIYNSNRAIQADADAWLEENPNTYPESQFTRDERRALAVEEILSEMSEAGPIQNMKWRAAFNRVAALIRKFARALSQLVGKNLAYSNTEVTDIITQAHNMVISGRTQLVPRQDNIRYMKAKHRKILTDAMRRVQSGAPSATKEILEGNINALDNLPSRMRSFKLSTFSLHHLMQLYEKYAPAFRRLNILVERMAKDASDLMVEHEKKAFKYREVLRNNPRFIDAFNQLANDINISQTPLLAEQLDNRGNFLRFVPDQAVIQRMRGIPANSAAYNALSPEDKVLHKAVQDFSALPADMQAMVADIFGDYRRYGDTAFQAKLEQFLNVLPPNVVAAIRTKYQGKRLKYYLPLRREGTYKLTYKTPDAKDVSEFYESKAAWEVGKEKAARAGGVGMSDEPIIIRENTYENGRPPTGLLKELSDNVAEALSAVNASTQTINDTQRIIFETFVDYMPGSAGNDLRQDMSSRQTWVFNGVTYYGRLGYNEDVVGVYESSVPRMLYRINAMKYTMPLEKVKEKINVQLKTYIGNKRGANNLPNPQYAGLPELSTDYVSDLQSEVEDRIRFAKNPFYSGYVYTLSKANYIYSIALNISSALINTTIIPMMAWPTLAAKYGVINASRAVSQAMGMFFRNAFRDPATGKLTFNQNPSFGNGLQNQTAPHMQEFAQLHRMLEMRSVTGTSAEQELQQAQNINVPGYEGLSAKANLVMSYAFRSSERMNREVTALAAYMLARNIDANGQKFDPNRGQASVGRATEDAIRLNYDVNGATLPETNSGLYQTDIGRIVLTFRTHALNMIINLALTFNQAVEKINANEPNAANRKLLRSIARKKLLYVFGSTYMLAGIKGLPLFGAAEVLASMLMGDDDEPYDLEQEVLDAVGTLGLNGPINELLNVDIGSRTGFYGLLWRDDPKRLAEVGLPIYVLERVAGPTYGLVEAARRGFNDLAEGEIVRASEALTPAPIRNLIKGMRYGVEGALTRDGLPIVEDVNAYNSMMQILGFAPADLAVAQSQRGATYEIGEKLKNRRVALLTNLYAARKAGNSEAVEKAMDDIRSFNEANPAYRIKGSTLRKSYEERERRAREAIGGVFQPRSLRIATSEYVTDLDEEEGLL